MVCSPWGAPARGPVGMAPVRGTSARRWRPTDVPRAAAAAYVLLQYDGVYRTMLVLSFAESEAWRVPAANLCEFGMVLFV